MKGLNSLRGYDRVLVAVDLLSDTAREPCVRAVRESLGLSASTISHHMAALVGLGFLTHKTQARRCVLTNAGRARAVLLLADLAA